MRKRYRFSRGALVIVFVSTLLGYITAQAQNITGFQNGYLTFTNENPSLYYRVEFKPNLSDPVEWDGSFHGLRNIQSPDPEVTVPVGVFYRVVGRDTPWVGGTALATDILNGKTAYVNEEEVTGTMANVGAQNVTPGTNAQAIAQGYHDGTGKVAGDTDLLAENIKKDVTVFGVTGTMLNAAVPKTGQATSYGVGSDGDLQKGVVLPSPRFTDNGNGTVTDNLTGLIWLKNANAVGQQEQWWPALDWCSKLKSGEGGLTDGSVEGDWRLPNLKELYSLIDLGRFDPALPSGHPFTGVRLGAYWTSTRYEAYLQDYLFWCMDLRDGHMYGEHFGFPKMVWPVRGGQ